MADKKVVSLPMGRMSRVRTLSWTLKPMNDLQVLADYQAADVSIELPDIGVLPIDMHRLWKDNPELYAEIADRIRSHETSREMKATGSGVCIL